MSNSGQWETTWNWIVPNHLKLSLFHGDVTVISRFHLLLFRTLKRGWNKGTRVVINRKFSVSSHVDNLLTSCSETLFALRTLRSHGLNDNSIQAIFRQQLLPSSLTHRQRGGVSPVLRTETASRPSCAAPSSSGTVVLRHHRSPLSAKRWKKGCSPNSAWQYPRASPFLPPVRESQYNLRDRLHNYQLPARTSSLRDCNYIIRILYRDL